MNVDENVERERERERAYLARPSSCNSSPTVMMLPEFRDRVYSRRAAPPSPSPPPPPLSEEYVAVDGGKVGVGISFLERLPVFYKPDECGLDFSGVPILFSAARFVPARLVFFFIIVFASSLALRLLRLRLPPPPLFFLVFFLPARNSFKIMQIRHPCHYFLAPTRREANFCTNRSAPKINVGWRYFILREKRSIAAPSYTNI